MIPTCELQASDCPPHEYASGFGICGRCGASISWHRGGSLDVYKGRDPDKVRREVHDAFFK